jgi:septin 7
MAKMESEMKAVFQQKVIEKETKLKQSEEEVYRDIILFIHDL